MCLCIVQVLDVTFLGDMIRLVAHTMGDFKTMRAALAAPKK